MDSICKIAGAEIPCEVRWRQYNSDWDCRRSVTVICALPYAEALTAFVSDRPWSIVDRNGKETDMSEYSVAGPITDNRRGQMECQMGIPTDRELLEILTGVR